MSQRTKIKYKKVNRFLWNNWWNIWNVFIFIAKLFLVDKNVELFFYWMRHFFSLSKINPKIWSQKFLNWVVCQMTSYDENSTTNKFQVEVAISYKDMKGLRSLSCELTCFKARILRQLDDVKCLTLRFFLADDNESKIRFSKIITANPIWRSLYL